MVDVDLLDILGPSVKTSVWITEAAADGLADFLSRDQPKGTALRKLRRYAENGFGDYEGSQKPVRLEGNGVFRVKITGGLFRLLGFYADGTSAKAEFIVIDTILKLGQKLNARDRAAIDRVAAVKRDGTWRKRNTE